MDSNKVEFAVEGIGDFVCYKEIPAKEFFMDRRVELAKILGGRVELARMEATSAIYEGSTDPLEKEIRETINFDVNRANTYLDLKHLIIKAPKGFVLEALTPNEFLALWLALETARKPFPVADQATADRAIEDSKA